MEWMIDRNQAALAAGGTWVSLVAALCLALPQPPNLIYVLIGAIGGLILIVIGFGAAARCRSISAHPFSQRFKLAALALLSGALLGAVLLSVLSFLVQIEPALRARFADRLTEPIWRPFALAFESSILEEVTFRLFTMSLLVWLAARLLRRPQAPFVVGLVGSSLLFGLAHLPAWASASHAGILLFALVLLLNGAGGLLFGWVYWRWGLPYAILAHFAGDVVVQGLGPRLLG
jgi:membrane protease YdiL (CAAX protease family)